MQAEREQLISIAGEGNVFEQELMSRHVTFRTGGPADFLVVADGEEKLAALLAYVKRKNIPFYIVGNGSNLLFPDEGYRGVVIKLARQQKSVQIEGNLLYAGAGVLLSQAARVALDAELTGMEFAAGIPGTLGGAVVMNAGAYGGEMADILHQVRVMDGDGQIHTIPKEALGLSYRHSIVPEKGWIVLEAVFALQPGNREAIAARMEELSAKRKEKQPLEYPSAGSTFKRPEGYFAAKLIEDAGLKGVAVGKAMVSEKHSGFVINQGGATTEDILRLIEKIQKEVWDKFHVKLEMEVKVVK